MTSYALTLIGNPETAPLKTAHLDRVCQHLATTGERDWLAEGLDTLIRLCDEKGLKPSDTLAVGDGANDIKMIQAAGLGVAFHGSESIKKQANACVDHGDLTTLLYIQGYRKSEFSR